MYWHTFGHMLDLHRTASPLWVDGYLIYSMYCREHFVPRNIQTHSHICQLLKYFSSIKANVANLVVKTTWGCKIRRGIKNSVVTSPDDKLSLKIFHQNLSKYFSTISYQREIVGWLNSSWAILLLASLEAAFANVSFIKL